MSDLVKKTADALRDSGRRGAADLIEQQAARIAALEAALKNVNVALTDAILRTRSIEDAELWTTIRDAARAALEGKPLGSLGRPTDWDIENSDEHQ